MAIVAAFAVIPLPLMFEGTLGTTDANGWLIIVYLTVVNGLLGHFLMAFAHGHVTLLTVSLLTLAIPVFVGGGRGVVDRRAPDRRPGGRHGGRPGGPRARVAEHRSPRARICSKRTSRPSETLPSP